MYIIHLHTLIYVTESIMFMFTKQMKQAVIHADINNDVHSCCQVLFILDGITYVHFPFQCAHHCVVLICISVLRSMQQLLWKCD